MEEQESTRLKSEEPLEISMDTKTLLTKSFRRMYTGAATILTVFCLPPLMFGVLEGNLTVMTITFLLATVPVVPLFLRGGFLAFVRIPIGIAFLVTALIGITIGMASYELINNGFIEGPKGEGSPIYGIIVLEFSGLLFFAPWLLSAIRGIRLWHFKDQAEQAVPSDGHKPSGRVPTDGPAAPADAQ